MSSEIPSRVLGIAIHRIARSAAAPATFLVCVLGCSFEGRARTANPPPNHAPQPAPHASASNGQTPPPDGSRLSGNVDVRPYVAHEAYALRRPDGDIDIKAFDRVVGPAIGCLSGELGLVDTQRTVTIQMPWPAAQGSVWTSTVGSPNPNHAGVFFMVRRGLGGSGQRASGDVRVIESSAKGGVLFVDTATPNQVGGVHGSVRGTLPFTICG